MESENRLAQDSADRGTETSSEDNRQSSPVQFHIEMASDRNESDVPAESTEPTAETPMLATEGANGKVKYSIGDMEVVEVVSRIDRL